MTWAIQQGGQALDSLSAYLGGAQTPILWEGQSVWEAAAASLSELFNETCDSDYFRKM